jgi:transcription-repair coupling factor (superfamily II helicase)
MEKTIREIKGEKITEDEVKPEIHLGLPAYIPEDYMPDKHRRLITYKRLSMAATDDDLSKIREEIIDCYGFIPSEVKNLFESISIRNHLKVIRGKKMRYNGESMLIEFHHDSPVNPSKIIELFRKKAKGVKLTPDYKLTVSMPALPAHEITVQAKELLQKLMN